MTAAVKEKNVELKLRKAVFFPPWLLLIAMVVISLVNGEAFLAGLNAVTSWILKNFSWLFNSVTVMCVVTVIVVYFSPLGKVRIGGRKAHPKMKFLDLVWITLCTTIAAGILFWACAEPLYHLYAPPASEGVKAGSPGAAIFAMKTMFLEWTWSPYAIYTVAVLVFAFVFYNMKQPYSMGSALVPALGERVKKYNGLVDVICLVTLVFLLVFGPTAYMLNMSVESWGAYIRDFLPMSLMSGDVFGDTWSRSWPIFYWCNWLSWTPVTAVFLGKILKGYTIKDAIKCNFIIPAIFSTIWMGLFSTATIYYELNGVGMYDTLLNKGTEAVVYKVFEQLPLAVIVIPFYLFIVFISFVTASDSNTNAMAGLCTSGITQEEQEAAPWLKIVWGITVGVVTWILISFAGIDGIKAASNLGGFPNMFIMILMIIGLLKIAKNPQKYDAHKEDYDSNGRPIESPRLPVKEEL